MLIATPLAAQIGQHVRQKRRHLRLKQSELAERAGTSQTAITRIEKGQGNPTLGLIQRLADALDLRINLHVNPTPKPEPSWLTDPPASPSPKPASPASSPRR